MKIFFSTQKGTGFSERSDGWTIEAIKELRSAGIDVEVIYY